MSESDVTLVFDKENPSVLGVDDSLCIRKSCLPDGSWPLTLSLTTVT